MSAPSTRRLAAVLIADVAGYSRLMERDESGTHARLLEIRAQVTDPAVLRNGGRIVRTVGDGLLVEFASAMAALVAGIEIQRAMAERNAGKPAAERIDHRIGINLGDILVDANDIAGNGVNVAARLETMAPPGGIAISGTVRDQVRQDLGVGFIDAGEHHVKNISHPIRVFTVQLEGTPARLARQLPLRLAHWPRWGAALAVVAGIAGTAVTFWPRSEPASEAQSLIVLPFAASPGTEPLAASLTNQVTSAVSRISGLVVISPTIAARFGAAPIDVKHIGRELGVRYALEGRVDAVGERVRVAAHLVTADTGATVWTGDIEAPRPPDGDALLEVIGRLSETVRSEFRAAELKRLAGQSETAYALALRATAELPNAIDLDELRAARTVFERALQLDAQHVLALVGLADALSFESQRVDVGPQRDGFLARADAASLRAVSIDPNNAEAWGTRAQVLLFRDQVDASAEAVERALKLNPYVSDLHALRAQVLMARGQATEAIAELDRAIGLNPRGNAVGVLLNYRCRALMMLGQYDAAIDACQRGMAFVPDWPDYMLLVAAYAMKDDLRRAAAAKAELMRLQPGFTIGWHAAVSGKARASQMETHVYPGLRKAGVPE